MVQPAGSCAVPRLGVSVVLWRSNAAQVATCLDALAASTTPPACVRILSNEDRQTSGSGWDLLPSSWPTMDVRVERCADNLGFAGGHNRLLASLFDEQGVSAVVVLNPDVAVAPDALDRLYAFAVTLGRPCLVGPLLELAHGDELIGEGLVDTAGIRWTRSGRHLDAQQGDPLGAAPSQPVRMAGISGACLLVTRAVHALIVERSGEFFDADFVAYREDAELGLRAAVLGVESWVVPAALGRHARSLRGTSRARSAHVNRLGVRNRFLIRFKYGHRRPGGRLGAPLRDLVVVAGVLLRERASLPGLADAWRLRRRMREKGQRVRQHAVAR